MKHGNRDSTNNGIENDLDVSFGNVQVAICTLLPRVSLYKYLFNEWVEQHTQSDYKVSGMLLKFALYNKSVTVPSSRINLIFCMSHALFT